MRISDALHTGAADAGAGATSRRPRGAGARGGRPKAEQRKESVQRLMDVARREFIAKGYDAATVEEIAASAGLTKGAVYFYFKSKANLLLSLLDEAERLTVEPAVAAVETAAAQGTARDQIVAFLHSQSLAGAEHADRMLLVILMSAELHGRGGELDTRLRSINDRMQQLLARVVTDGKRAGEFTSDVPTAELVSVILAVNQGCYLEWYRRRDELRGADLVRALRTVVLYGVLAQPAGAAEKTRARRDPADNTGGL